MKGHSWTLGIVEVRTLHSPGECSPDSGVSHGSVELIRDPFYKTVMSYGTKYCENYLSLILGFMVRSVHQFAHAATAQLVQNCDLIFHVNLRYLFFKIEL